MKSNPEDLEKFIHETLRTLPDRKAPSSLELRVRAAIEARAALPWWRQSFMQWPVAARGAFAVLSVGLLKLAMMLTVWIVSGYHNSPVVSEVANHFSWAEAVLGGVRAVSESMNLFLRNIPSLWIYGAIVCVAAAYATLFSLGATAYRALYSNRA